MASELAAGSGDHVALRLVGAEHEPAEYEIPFRVYSPGDYRIRSWSRAAWDRLPAARRPPSDSYLVIDGGDWYVTIERDGDLPSARN